MTGMVVGYTASVSDKNVNKPREESVVLTRYSLNGCVMNGISYAGRLVIQYVEAVLD